MELYQKGSLKNPGGHTLMDSSWGLVWRIALQSVQQHDATRSLIPQGQIKRLILFQTGSKAVANPDSISAAASEALQQDAPEQPACM